MRPNKAFHATVIVGLLALPGCSEPPTDASSVTRVSGGEAQRRIEFISNGHVLRDGPFIQSDLANVAARTVRICEAWDSPGTLPEVGVTAFPGGYYFQLGNFHEGIGSFAARADGTTLTKAECPTPTPEQHFWCAQPCMVYDDTTCVTRITVTSPTVMEVVVDSETGPTQISLTHAKGFQYEKCPEIE